MDLHVKRFTIRYRGKDYGPGSVIYDVPDKEAKALVVGSNGTIEGLPMRKPGRQPETDMADAGGATGAEGLPSLDPAKTVK